MRRRAFDFLNGDHRQGENQAEPDGKLERRWRKSHRSLHRGGGLLVTRLGARQNYGNNRIEDREIKIVDGEAAAPFFQLQQTVGHQELHADVTADNQRGFSTGEEESQERQWQMQNIENGKHAGSDECKVGDDRDAHRPFRYTGQFRGRKCGRPPTRRCRSRTAEMLFDRARIE